MIHGHSIRGKETRTYTSYRGMKGRCKRNKYYLKNNIEVCDEWLGLNGFNNFLNDMGERPAGKELDRIDSLKGYNKNNCRWVTKSKNDSNRLPYGILKLKGISKTKSNKFESHVWDNRIKKYLYLGTFDCPVIASTKYQLKHLEIYGE